MKKILLLLTLSIFIFNGCSEDKEENKNSSIVGTWVKHYYYVDNSLNKCKQSNYTEFNEDGSGASWYTDNGEMWKQSNSISKYTYLEETKTLHRKWDEYSDVSEYGVEISGNTLKLKNNEDNEEYIYERCPEFVEKIGGYNPNDIIGIWCSQSYYNGRAHIYGYYEFIDDKKGVSHYEENYPNDPDRNININKEFTYSIDITKNEITFTYIPNGMDIQDKVKIYKIVDITKDYIYISSSDIKYRDDYELEKWMRE